MDLKKSSNRDSDPLVDGVKSFLKDSSLNRLIVGLSGGADSVALLCALRMAGASVSAIHCNFHLRGDESERDQMFVESLCRRLQIPLEVVDFDVEAHREKYSGSVEMACREMRYRLFEERLSQSGFDRIAVAHNSDDNAETLLLNLMRGAGVAGLAGMRPDTGTVVRPLLNVSRKEIEDFLERIGEVYIVDSTNLTSDYRRNFLRNEVIPLLEKEWPEAKRSINRTAGIMSRERDAAKAFERREHIDNHLSYSRIRIDESGPWLLRRFVLGKGGTDYIAEEILRSARCESVRIGARWITESGEFISTRNGIEWVGERIAVEGEDLSEEFDVEELELTPELMREVKSNRANNILWLPVRNHPIVLRRRKKGDRIRPLGMRGSRLVSEIIKESGLSENEKRGVAVAEDPENGDIIWVEGLKRSSDHLLGEDMRKVWRISRKS